jgi:hypothetical protein
MTEEEYRKEILGKILEASIDTECIKCGYCCSKAICGYGEIEDGECKFLKIDDNRIGTYKCLKYEEIILREKEEKYPMFGCGCSSTLFNDIRDAVRKNISSSAKI